MLLGAELAVSVYAERVSGERAAEHEAQEWHPKGDRSGIRDHSHLSRTYRKWGNVSRGPDRQSR